MTNTKQNEKTLEEKIKDPVLVKRVRGYLENTHSDSFGYTARSIDDIDSKGGCTAVRYTTGNYGKCEGGGHYNSWKNKEFTYICLYKKQLGNDYKGVYSKSLPYDGKEIDYISENKREFFRSLVNVKVLKTDNDEVISALRDESGRKEIVYSFDFKNDTAYEIGRKGAPTNKTIEQLVKEGYIDSVQKRNFKELIKLDSKKISQPVIEYFSDEGINISSASHSGEWVDAPEHWEIGGSYYSTSRNGDDIDFIDTGKGKIYCTRKDDEGELVELQLQFRNEKERKALEKMVENIIDA